MSTPTRIQRRRTRGWRAPDGAVYVGRGTVWGNPYAVVRQADGLYGIPDPIDSLGPWATFDHERDARGEAVLLFRGWLDERPKLVDRARRELAGRDLMCWCPLPEPGEPDHCHAAVLLRLANGGAAHECR
ncbi:DUF4326 domain-containing protein [Streptomyces sp. NBC_01775]|uniref:DUF4326 domain-containing protein n=1 Tax=Streptomyces sp. NBC_01775 TaxID=2975939 RepID=UPI002DD9F40F|nr:DUF4326 domain-containing protein [Streptomyces sp. NBC_01775]WSB74791.1 DUF4326 domain-containing protein [Streptomyces sp. NBC_01775]